MLGWRADRQLRRCTVSDVLIVGANGAIGSALLQHYGEMGQRVSALSRKVAPAWAMSKPWLDWTVVNEDEPDQLQHQMARCFASPPTVVFLCQGWLHTEGSLPEKAISQLSVAHMQQSLAVNLISPSRYLQAMMPYLFKQMGIKVLVLSAKVGSITDNQLGGWYSYRASKAALNMLVKTASIELLRRNKTASLVTVHPGTTASDLSAPFQARVPEAQLQTPASTAKRLAQVADNLSVKETGCLLNWDGHVLPF